MLDAQSVHGLLEARMLDTGSEPDSVEPALEVFGELCDWHQFREDHPWKRKRLPDPPFYGLDRFGPALKKAGLVHEHPGPWWRMWARYVPTFEGQIYHTFLKLEGWYQF